MPTEKTQRLRKELGLFNVYALATGTTLSAGFFLLPGIATKEAGPAVILAYLIAALPMIPAMFSIIELSTAMPRAGGAYYFLDRSMGPLVGTIGGFGTWLALMLKTSFALIGMGAYVQLLTNEQSYFSFDIPDTWLAIILALFFGFVNLRGAKGAAGFQIWLVNGLLLILLLFMTGVRSADSANLSDFFACGADTLLSTAGMVYISYVGLTNVASVAEEVHTPERNLPLGIILALSTSLVIYGVGTYIMVGVLGTSSMSDIHSESYKTPVAAAARVIFGNWGAILLSVAAVFAFSSVVNAGILSASRYPLAMSRDHLLPAWFGKITPAGLPITGVLVTVGITIAFVLLLDVKEIAKLASAFQLLMFALICVAVIIMRESHIESYDPGYHSPLYPWMQIFGVAMSALLIAKMGTMPILFSSGLMIAGCVWYFQYARSRTDRFGAIFHIFERLGRQRYAGLDIELREIMKEKGLRSDDPFDEVVARAGVIEVPSGDDFQAIAVKAADLLEKVVPEPATHLLDGFLRDNRIGATPVADGAALPHLRIANLEHPQLVVVRAKHGVSVQVSDSFGEEMLPPQTVYALFFLVSPDNNPGQHLRILAQIAGRMDNRSFMGQWMAGKNEQDIKECLLRAERFLSIVVDRDSETRELVDARLRDLRWPEGCLIALVRRHYVTFVPSAQTILHQDDRVTVIGDPKAIQTMYEKYHDAHATDRPLDR